MRGEGGLRDARVRDGGCPDPGLPADAPRGAGLPVLTGGRPQHLRFGGGRPSPPGPRLQPQHLSHGRDAVPVARGGRLPGLSGPPPARPDRAPCPGARSTPTRIETNEASMFSPISRRRFVTASAGAGALATLGDFAFLSALPAPAAAPNAVRRRLVSLDREIEPLVQLIEDTPRQDLMAKITAEVHKGTSYEDLLSAVFLAGVRGIQPRPVGFKFHAVLVIHSAHQAALAAADRDRWLPLFWAIDNFKASQARNKVEGDWRMGPVEEARLPAAHQAKARFMEAMDNWDPDGADRAIAAFSRSAGLGELFEVFLRYGARDFRDIGHKAIYVANGFRTLQTISNAHPEPVLRSLAYALLDHQGGNPARRDGEEDRPGRDNLKRLRDLASVQPGGKHSPEAATELLACLRTGTAAEGSARVAELLKTGIHPDSLWDGVFLAAGELLMRQPGIGGLHCVTTANALHYGYTASRDEDTRRFLLLQGAAFMPMFRAFMAGRGKLPDLRLDKLEKAELKGDVNEVVADIFADVGKAPMAAARKTMALVEAHPGRLRPLMATARRLIFAKGRDSHDYKFSSAALEDYFSVSAPLQSRYAAASVFWLKGSGERDNDLIRRTR